jgi:hypothetical protein
MVFILLGNPQPLWKTLLKTAYRGAPGRGGPGLATPLPESWAGWPAVPYAQKLPAVAAKTSRRFHL